MTYATLMVHLELGHENTSLLRVAGNLAERFHANVIGIAACQPMQMMFGDGYVSGDFIEQDIKEIEREMKATEAEFRKELEHCSGTLEWRSTTTGVSISNYIAQSARSADLVVTGNAPGALFDAQRHLNMGDLIMQAGRPVLIVPAGSNQLKLENMLIGWNDTREARRAIFDALPLLKIATYVAVVELVTESKLADARVRLADVVRWLKRHGVDAEPIALPSNGDDTKQLNTIAHEQNADVIVAGAYGHSRLREWALGGITRGLLLPEHRCSFVSH